MHVSIHEDDEGMRNLYPAALANEVYSQMDKAVEASERNRSASGLGWDAIHQIQRPSKKYSDFGLRADQCGNALETVLPRIKQFEIGGMPNNPFYSNETEAYCYGLGNELYIKLETSGDLVTHIWFDIWTANPKKLSTLRRAFSVIDKIAPSVLADYWLHADGILSDHEFLNLYFKELSKFDGEEPQ